TTATMSISSSQPSSPRRAMQRSRSKTTSPKQSQQTVSSQPTTSRNTNTERGMEQAPEQEMMETAERTNRDHDGEKDGFGDGKPPDGERMDIDGVEAEKREEDVRDLSSETQAMTNSQATAQSDGIYGVMTLSKGQTCRLVDLILRGPNLG